MVCFLLSVVAQAQPIPATLALHEGTRKVIRSFDIGTSNDLARLKASTADLIIIRFAKWGPNPEKIATDLKNGPNGRRVVLVDFPAFGANPGNVLLWRNDWDSNQDGKPDADGPTWLKPRNAQGDYPLASESPTLRNRMLGASGLVATVARAGFDGLVLSTVQDPAKKPGADARLAADIMFEGRKYRRSFALFMRNPAVMLDYTVIRNYFDGYVADGAFYGSRVPGEPSESAFVEDTVQRLSPIARRGRAVLAIAYTTDPTQIGENKKLAEERQFIPLALPKRLESAP